MTERDFEMERNRLQSRKILALLLCEEWEKDPHLLLSMGEAARRVREALDEVLS